MHWLLQDNAYNEASFADLVYDWLTFLEWRERLAALSSDDSPGSTLPSWYAAKRDLE